MTHPVANGCFHSLASLGYIPFALTSVLMATSTPFLSISSVGIILLALVPPLTLFPLLCLSYRRLERFDAISLTVQRARIYIMVAGSGLCVLVAAHLIMVHVVGNSHSTTYNRTTLLYPPSPMQVRALATWTADSNNNTTNSSNTTTNNSSSRTGIATTTATLDVSPMDMLVLDKSIKITAETDKAFQSIPFTTTTTTTTSSTTIHPEPVSSDIQLDQIQAGASEATNTLTTTSIAVATTEASVTTAPTATTIVPTPTEPKAESESTDSHSPLVHFESRNYPSPGYHLASIHLLLFLAAQIALLVLLTTLFLGVLIMTEFVLDREDENEDVARAQWYFWGRVLGVITATVASAVHGSFLSAYVLLDGQSDCIAKAVVGTILFYWIGMITVMNRTTGPLPY